MTKRSRDCTRIIFLPVIFIIASYPMSIPGKTPLEKIWDCIPTNIGIDAGYLNRHPGVTVDFGFGFEQGREITLNDVPREIRYMRPHPDDSTWRKNDILEHSNNDNYNNYTISQSKADVKIADKIYLDVLGFSYRGLVNVLWRTSSLPMMDEERIEGKNFFSKNYIKPGSPGAAYIYYRVRYQYHDFFSKSSYSFPVYLHFPALQFCNQADKTLFYLNGFVGTNILKPEKIQLEYERGWDRWGNLQAYEKKEAGQIIEKKYFAGCDVELPIAGSFLIKLQYHYVLINHQENSSTSMKIGNKTKATNAFGLKFVIHLTKPEKTTMESDSSKGTP